MDVTNLRGNPAGYNEYSPDSHRSNNSRANASNNSHTTLGISERDKGKVISLKAVILAGGFGTRLRPLSYLYPKPMVPIRGKPFLQYLHGFFEGSRNF